MTIEFWLPVRPATKKNSQQIRMNRKTGARFIAQSDNYRDFEQACLLCIPNDLRLNIATPCTVTTVFHMPDKRRVDLTNLLSAISDVLVKAKVIADDCCSIVTSVDGSRVVVDGKVGIDVRIEL